jgi:hypothetical protein
VVDKNCAGICSTSSATSLLEYQLDEHADAIKKYLSKEEAVAAYRLGLGAINDIASFVKTYGNRCHFSKRPTLVYTQKKSDENELMREYKFRKDNGFRTKIINNNNNPFPFDIECDIYCEDGGAEFNSYLFCKQMLQQAQKHGAKIYEHTEVVKIEYEPQITTVFTNYNISIKCKKVICATGYNTSLFAEKELCDLFTSFTIVTSPLKNFTWHKKTLLHDNGDPYHYIRLSPDNRLIIGGEDTKLSKQINPTQAEEKYKLLENYLLTLFPNLKNTYTLDYKFCGAFGTTLNNLSVIGPCGVHPNLWFMLGYGANGIINSVFGAQMLRDLYFNKEHPYLYLFSSSRKLT